MGGRKQKIREVKSGIYIIGEGITEQYYFSHIKQIMGFHCIIKPRFFGNTSIAAMRIKIEDLLRSGVFVICVFDADVLSRNESEKRRLEQLRNRYKNNKNLLLCASLPSIEFWFLLHYLDTGRHFRDAK
ncbi:MAG: RloB family protein, partial [Bacteroidales bacterium]|nr:RloB family protein [Bacteroidales bacterium]